MVLPYGRTKCPVCDQIIDDHEPMERALCKIARHLESINKRMGGK